VIEIFQILPKAYDTDGKHACIIPNRTYRSAKKDNGIDKQIQNPKNDTYVKGEIF